MGTSSGLYVLIAMSDQRACTGCCSALAALVYLVGWLIGRSRLGFALRIIGNDEVVAVHCGINTARAKVVLFVISSTFAAITGALVAPRWSYVEPSIAFSPFLSFEVVIMALLGGVHRLWGPLVGVIPFTLLWEFISAKFPAQTTLLLGACFLLIVYFIPHGVVGLIEDLVRRSVGAAADLLREGPACLTLHSAALRVEGVTKRFGGLVAVDDMSFELARERGAGPDRPERLRQDHDAQPDLRRAEAERRRRSGSTATTFRRRRRAEIATRGVARTFQIVRMLPSLTVLENVAAGGVFGHSRRWGRELDDLRPRACCSASACRAPATPRSRR